MTNKTLEMVAGLALLFLFTTPAPAVDRQMLHGHVPAAVANFNLQPLGRLPATNRLNLLIGLPLRNPGRFTNLLAQLYDPRSANFHRWLTPDQIAQQFGPDDQDYQAVIAYAKTNGLTVTATHADHTLLRVQGAVADIEKILHVTMRVYQHPWETRTFYAPDVEPSLDLSVPLLHISGLDNFHIPHPGAARGSPSNILADANMGSGPTNSYWGNDFRTVYVPGTSLTGSGQVLGLLELDGYYFNDIAAYISNSGILTSVVLTNVSVDGFNLMPSGISNTVLEVSADIELAIAMAPGLDYVIVYETQNGGENWVDILKQMQEDNIAKQLSASWSIHDDMNADPVYLEFAVQGQSFFLASGDLGAYTNGILEWADDPNVTIVGGTSVYTTNGTWQSENAWVDSGGGISASWMGDFSIPGWQQGVNMSLNGGSSTMRNVPDVAMNANNDVYAVYNNGMIITGLGGCSLSTPLWAAFTALVNEQAVANGQPTVGFLNPALIRDRSRAELYQLLPRHHTRQQQSDPRSKWNQQLPGRDRLRPRHRLGFAERHQPDQRPDALYRGHLG